MAIAEHEPDKLYARNSAMLQMTRQQLHDFAATKTKGLPQRVKKGAGHEARADFGQADARKL